MLGTCARQSSRREFIAAGAAAALSLRRSLSLAGPGLLGGSVFHDRRGTGTRGPGDPGLAGVMVSNGREVVLTDQDGRWRLPARRWDEIFLIKPPHWTTPSGPGGVPMIGASQVLGTAAGGAAPNFGSGELPSLDFALIRAPERAQFEAALMADTQPANAAELGYLCDDIISNIVGTGAVFGINHGDVVFDDLSLYARYRQMLGTSGLPWHHCPGNHDIDQAATS